MSDLTARIEALETTYELQSAREAVVLAEYTVRNPDATFDAQWALDAAAELLTALEQAQEEIRAWSDTANWWMGEAYARQAIGAARLKLAERAQIASARMARVAERGEIEAIEAANKAEAELFSERAKDDHRGEWKRKYLQAKADLEAERAKRCDTCERHKWDIFRQEWKCRIEDASCGADDFSCSEHQLRKQAPNVAQQGSERDANGTGEASE